MFSVMRRGHLHRSVKACSGGLLLVASLNVGRLHRFESVERIILAASRACGGNTRSAVSGAWSLSRCVQRVEGITSASIKRGWQLSAGHRVNVPATPDLECLSLCAVSPWLAGQSRETMTQIMRENVKVAGYLHQWWCTLAKTSHMRRTDATCWMHRACACSTYVSAAQACYTRASRWVRVVRPQQRSWLIS